MHALEALVEEARRDLAICNACRYCEGYCAVFPAIERGSLADGDVMFIANVCHDCRACFQACMYAPPHEFALDLPAALAAVRSAGYASLVWPAALSRAFERPVATKLIALGVGVLVALAASLWSGDASLVHSIRGKGSFYEVMSANVMMGLFLALSLLSFLLLLGGFVRFWAVARSTRTTKLRVGDILGALGDAATLRHASGGGGGCYYPDPDRPSGTRRICHSLVVYGMTSAFAATVVAAIQQHFFHMLPPYAFLSAPVILGTVGGVAVVAGGAGLAWLRYAAAAARSIGPQISEYMFVAALETVSVTGLLLLVFRESAAMPILLIVHLGSVAALYLSIPYSKFVHAVHRLAALVIDNAERRALARTTSPGQPLERAGT